MKWPLVVSQREFAWLKAEEKWFSRRGQEGDDMDTKDNVTGWQQPEGDNNKPAGDGVKSVGEYDLVAGRRIDGSVTQVWGTKAKAVAAAKAIGWPVNSVARVHTRFQMGFGLKETFDGYLTREKYAALAMTARGTP